jgi:plastocyanin
MRNLRTTEIVTKQAFRLMAAAVALSFSFALTAGALGRPSTAAQQEKTTTNEVTIDKFMFAPKELTIVAGTEVSWINKDDEAHTVVSVGSKLFKSKALDTGDKFSFTFHDPGTYEYLCSIHAQMTGKIIVK